MWLNQDEIVHIACHVGRIYTDLATELTYVGSDSDELYKKAQKSIR